MSIKKCEHPYYRLVGTRLLCVNCDTESHRYKVKDKEQKPKEKKRVVINNVSNEAQEKLSSSKEAKPLPKEKEETLLTQDVFSWIVKQSRLNITELASVLGVSRWMVYALLNGKRRFTLKMSKKIRDKLPVILPEVSEIRKRALKYSKLLRDV